MRMTRILGLLAAATLIAFATGAGCVVTISPDGNTNANGNDNGAGGKITIRLVNTASSTLDPEFYVSADPVTTDQLFDASHKFTAYGVGTIGLLADRDDATFELDCAAARVFGTKGGRFGNNLNSPDGVSQQVVLTQDVSVRCGQTVTLTYSRSGNSFTTSLSVR
ncbi:MAG: hypothetical protein U1D55_17020 [Phycisphaerae bacterium]